MTPVLVVGAGPVGLVTALLLARWGVPTVVLEAAPERELVGSKSICVQRDVLDIYHRVGVADALLAEGVTWNVGRTYYRGRELFSFTFPDPGRSAYPGFINIPQSSVERELAAAVAERREIDLRYAHRVDALRQEGAAVTVRAQTPTGPREFTGTHLVAADGPRSTVRSLLGLDFAGHSFDDLFLIADIRVELPFQAERHFHLDPEWNPGRQVLVHPQPGSVWRIDWQVPADYDLAADRAGGGLDARIRRITGPARYEIVWLSAYRFHQRLASRMRVGRILLAGDAAHLMAPFGARGLNSGVQDAENAAWKIAFSRQGRAGPRLLDSYEVERRAAAAENLRVTGGTMRFLVPQTEAERAYRSEVLERAVHDPAARPLVNSGRLAEPFRYTDSPLTTGGAPAGALCPDGPVTIDGRKTRLRELFGAGFTTLGRHSAYPIEEIDHDGVVAGALDADPRRTWLVRPDGHLAAVLDGASHAAVAAAQRTALGFKPR